MDDLEFRRRCYANPHDKDAEFLQKQQDDANAVQLATELQQLDKQIHATLHVPVPTGLAERITLNQTLQKYQRHRRQQRWWIALAAATCVLLCVSALSWRLFIWQPVVPMPAFNTLVLEHIRQEPHALVTQQQVSSDQVQALFRHFGGYLQRDLPGVSYAALCIMHKQLGIHLVLDGQAGKVTVLFVPEITIAHVELVQDTEWAGLILPMARGGVAIIGEKTEPLQLVAAQVQESIVFVN